MTEEEEFAIRVEAKLDQLLWAAGEHHVMEANAKIKQRTPADELPQLVTDDMLRKLGFVERYYLIGHPGWPDPMAIWPATYENAKRVWDEFPHENASIIRKWEQGPRTEVFPRRPEDAWERRKIRVKWDAANNEAVLVEDIHGEWKELGAYPSLVLWDGYPYLQKVQFIMDQQFRDWSRKRVSSNGRDEAVYEIYRLKEGF